MSDTPANEAEPAPAIAAATVVIARDAPAGLQVLMLRKNSKIHFGGMWVFQGGRLDPEDHDGAHDIIDAHRRAAVREAEEEAGLRVSAGDLVHFSHWLPPPGRRVRFSTHFFLVRAPAAVGEVAIDGGEIVDHAWIAPAAALARREAGEIELVTPTFVTLSWLACHPDTGAALRSIEAPQHFHTRIVQTDAGRVALYHGDTAYESGDLAAPGPRRRANMLETGWYWEEHDGAGGPAAG